MLEETTTSLVCFELTEVKTLTSSGIRAPAMVPQDRISDSFHHRPPSRPLISSPETAKVEATQMIDVIHTSDVRGASKFMSWAPV